MKQFIYVFDDETRDALLSLGYELLKSNKKGKVYVFKSNDKLVFTLEPGKFVYSDTISY